MCVCLGGVVRGSSLMVTEVRWEFNKDCTNKINIPSKLRSLIFVSNDLLKINYE